MLYAKYEVLAVARCKNCWIPEQHPEIVDESIVFGDGCPAEVYGYECPDYDLMFDEDEEEDP